MPAAGVPLANRALRLLGDQPITDFTDDSERAECCRSEYEPLVAELLQSHDWNFASRRAANLPLLADPIEWSRKFTYAYLLPGDCLRVRATSADRAEGGEGVDWEVEGLPLEAGAGTGTVRGVTGRLTLVSGTTPLSIRYTFRQFEGLWSPAFATAVVYELTARLAGPITAKPSYVELYNKLAPMRLAIAKALDGQEGAPRRYHTDVLTRERR